MSLFRLRAAHGTQAGQNPVQGINQHLPESVRALAVQRVNKGFNARERCGTRTYHYFLPAAALDLAGDGEMYI